MMVLIGFWSAKANPSSLVRKPVTISGAVGDDAKP